MAIVNRTPDSFYRPGLTWDETAAMDRVHQVVAEGADIVDIGGVPAKPGEEVPVAEEIRRVVPFIKAVRGAYPDLVISVDTWRHEIGRAACEAGADLLNDSWGGWDSELAVVAAESGAGILCSHTGGQTPRTRPFRVAYDDVVADVLDQTLGLASRAVSAGVDPDRVIIDPAHDFGKNTWHSLEITRRLEEMVETGWPVLVSASRKDFVGETLGLPVNERLTGTLAVTAVTAWMGARIFRAGGGGGLARPHDVAATRQALDMITAVRGDLAPARVVRGLALSPAMPASSTANCPVWHDIAGLRRPSPSPSGPSDSGGCYTNQQRALLMQHQPASRGEAVGRDVTDARFARPPEGLSTRSCPRLGSVNTPGTGHL
jgi:dihydropteroate synthase